MKIGNVKISEIKDLIQALEIHRAGEVVAVEFVRMNETIRFKVKLGKR